MALPLDDATTLLTTTSAAVRQVYHDLFPEMHPHFGAKWQRIFKPNRTRKIEGDGVNVQVKHYNLGGTQFDTDINADFPKPYSFGAATYKVTLSETAASNDFRRASLSLQTTWLDIKRRFTSEAAAVDYVKELSRDAMREVGEKLSVADHLSSTGRLALINGTPVKNDNKLVANASTLTTSGGARARIDNGSIAYFRAGTYVDIYSGATNTRRYSAFVTGSNPADTTSSSAGSVGFYGLDANGQFSTTVDMSATGAGGAVADNDSIYFKNSKDKNIKSAGFWFGTDSDTSFFGKDRTNPLFHWMDPFRYSAGSSAVQLSKTHIDDAMVQMGYVNEEMEGGYVAVMQPELEQRYRNEIGNDILIQYPTGEQKGKIFAGYGFDGSIYRHPNLGRIMLQADPQMLPNKIWFMRVGDWETIFPIGQEFDWMPGSYGNWYRMPSSVAGAGDTTTFRMDGFVALARICLFPNRQVEMSNITA